MAEFRIAKFSNINADIDRHFRYKFGEFTIYSKVVVYCPKDESLSKYNDKDGSYLVFPLDLNALKMTEKSLEKIMRDSLEQNKDLLFPLVKPFAERTIPDAIY